MPVRFRYGTAGNDTIDGYELKDAIFGRAGNDLLRGLGGNDRLYGEAGDDRLDGGDGGDEAYGGSGDDLLLGGRGADWLNGGTGSDDLRGGADGDFLNYGAGAAAVDAARDRLYGEAGDDYLNLYGTGAIRDKGWGGAGADDFTFYGRGAVGYGEAGDDRFYNSASGVEGGLSPGGTAFVHGGAGADTLWIAGYDDLPLTTTFVDWQPGVDRLDGWVDSGGNDVVEFVTRTFDVNRDGHVDRRDGNVQTGDHSLTFAPNPATGELALTLRLHDQVLYLPNSDALF